MKILILDNYDSFTYNLVHLLEQFKNVQLDVFRNDAIRTEEVKKYDKILLSPGPGLPADAGIMMEVIKNYASSKSILGVCLGHQGIAESFGGKLINLDQVKHGVATKTIITDAEERLFHDVPSGFMSGHYHSWAVEKSSLPACFRITAEDEEGIVMAISHRSYDLKGVQFHPESIMTEHGKKIMENWLRT